MNELASTTVAGDLSTPRKRPGGRSARIGNAVLILRHPDNRMDAAADPRGSGVALIQ